MWSIADIADAIEAGLRIEAARIDTEQAVYGLDTLGEIAFHPILARILESAGYGVHREQRYPADRRRRIESEGERCDIVLTSDGRALAVPFRGGAQSLFDPPEPVPLDEAFWLEVKVVSQFTTEGSNHSYTSQLLSGVRRDVSKLSKDPGILHAGLLLILWVADTPVAEHDLRVWYERCISRGLPIAIPSLRLLPISDRIGNGVCAVALYPISHL